jgi:hypothetical protein
MHAVTGTRVRCTAISGWQTTSWYLAALAVPLILFRWKILKLCLACVSDIQYTLRYDRGVQMWDDSDHIVEIISRNCI